jgi:hypothetical protein
VDKNKWMNIFFRNEGALDVGLALWPSNGVSGQMDARLRALPADERPLRSITESRKDEKHRSGWILQSDCTDGLRLG